MRKLSLAQNAETFLSVPVALVYSRDPLPRLLSARSVIGSFRIGFVLGVQVKRLIYFHAVLRDSHTRLVELSPE